MEASTEVIADGVEQRLDPRVIELHRLRNSIHAALLIITSLSALVAAWVGIGEWAAGLVLVPLWLVPIGLAVWQLWRWPAIAYRHASYRIDDLGIEIRKGAYWRAITNVPRSRVQHTDVSQGPLERRFGLGTLVIHTAGTMNAKVTLAGLEHATARRLRTFLIPGADSDAV